MSDPIKPKCCTRIFGGYRYNSCSRAGTVERDGKHYCRQHDPIAISEARERRSAKYQLAFEESMKIRRLHAAAPELLEALEQAVTSMQDSGYSDNHVTVKAARDAIAKSKGETK